MLKRRQRRDSIVRNGVRAMNACVGRPVLPATIRAAVCCKTACGLAIAKSNLTLRSFSDREALKDVYLWSNLARWNSPRSIATRRGK